MMIIRNYYCLIAGLPDIVIDQKKSGLHLAEFKKELSEVLHPADYKLLEFLFLPHDNLNLLNLLLKNNKPYEPLGKYSTEQLEEEIKEPELAEDYLNRFIIYFKETSGEEPAEGWQNYLTDIFYESMISSSSEFISGWFTFEKNLSNILVAFNCRKYGMQPENELIGDDAVVDALRKSHARDFGISGEVPYIEKLISIIENKNLLEREKGIDLLKWNLLDENTTFHYFTIEVVLAYMIKLQIIHRWMMLDEDTGRALFNKLLNELWNTREFPVEFNTNERT